MHTHPDVVQGERARQQAQRMFQRVLASWASDLLALRARGLQRPTRRTPGAGLTVRKAA